MSLGSRLKHAWNAFSIESRMENMPPPGMAYGGAFGISQSRARPRMSNERTIISSIYTRIAIDVAAIEVRHSRHNENGRYAEDIDSGLNDCLTLEANIDQAARAFRQDIVATMFDWGAAAIVPVDTTLDPTISGSYDIKTMRVGYITEWFPYHVRVHLYNELRGRRQDIVLEKKWVAIVENPLYSVMNEPNSTLQRLIRKLNLLDSVDEASSSGKLDLIIQLPYVIKSDARRQQADQRRKDIEFQLKGSQYGVAYTDGTEKITQLNRPVENNLLAQIQFLTTQLYSELGLTPEVMEGTANEAAMLNYTNRTIEPIMTAIVEAMRRTFLTKTARTQGQSIDYFRDVFKLVPLSNLAVIADKFTRNEILSSNEIRQAIGFPPSSDPKADELRNSNMPDPNAAAGGAAPAPPTAAPVDGSAAAQSSTAPPADPNASASSLPGDPKIMASAFDDIETAISSAFSNLGIDEGGTADANA